MPELITTEEGFDAPAPVSAEVGPGSEKMAAAKGQEVAVATLDPAPEVAAQPEVIPQSVVKKEPDELLPEDARETFRLLEKLRDDIERTPAMEKHKPEFKALNQRFERVKLHWKKIQQVPVMPPPTADDWEVERAGQRARISLLVPRVLRRK